MNAKQLLTFSLLAIPVAGLVLAATSQATSRKEASSDRIARGKYLVTFGGCNDCHTPLKMTEKGPQPDLSRMLSGHPADVKLPPPELKNGPWFASTAGMTAWAGPWGISFASNLTPDNETGMGVWTEEIFIKAMRTGKHMGEGREILPPMPWRGIAALNDEDLKSIYAYLRTVPSVRNQVPQPTPPAGTHDFE